MAFQKGNTFGFKKGQEPANRKFFLSREELEKLYWKENMTSGKIAKKYGVDYTTVLNWLRHYNIPIKKLGNQIKKFNLTKEELHELYWNQKMSMDEIAKKTGVTGTVIHRWMRIYDISSRYRSELSSGENNPAYKHGKPHCIDCKKELSNYNNIRCQSCFHKWMVGENHPHYRGIGRPPYPFEFTEKLRSRIRKRDHYACRECGKTRKEIGYKPHVHHIDFDKNNNAEDNLICLCRKCHAKAYFNREDWIRHFREKIHSKV